MTVERFGSQPFEDSTREIEATLRERGEHLKTLGPNWDSYGGEAPNPEAVDKAIDLALAIAPLFDYPPQLVPCQDGVQVEWHTMGYDVEMWVARSGPSPSPDPEGEQR